ncbi:MAG: polysaccharide pyruvyl transferase family protein [Cyanobacteria bacterium P01_A01_bin.114]
MGRALICGYYGHYNLGDEAMLAGMLHQLRQWRPEASPTVYSNHPTDTAQRHGVATFNQAAVYRRRAILRRRLELLWTLTQHRYFVLGGGDLLRDGPQRSVAAVWLTPLQQAIALRRRSVVWGVSVGEVWRPETAQQIRQVLNTTELIGVRDNGSAEALRSLGVIRPIYVGPDLALLRPVPLSVPASPSGPEGLVPKKRLQVGVAWRAIANRHRSANAVPENAAPDGLPPDNFEHLQRSMAALLDWLVETYDAEIHLIPFQAFPEAYRRQHRPAVDDYSSTLTLLRGCRHAEQMQLYSYVPYLGQLDAILSKLDLMIGMRLHSLILAARMGIPSLAIEYDLKVSRFMAAVGQSHNSISLKNFTLPTAISKTTQLLDDIDAARQSVRVGLHQYHQAGAMAMAAFEDFWRA